MNNSDCEAGNTGELGGVSLLTLYDSPASDLVSASKEIDPSSVKGLSRGIERARLPRMRAVTGPGATNTKIEAVTDEDPEVAVTVTVYKLPTSSEYAGRENLVGSLLEDSIVVVRLFSWTVHTYLIAAKDEAHADGLAADRMVSGDEADMVR